MSRAATHALCLAASCLALALAGCSSDEKTEKPKPEPESKTDKKSNVKRITTSVPMGKKVACSDLVPDLGKFKEYVAEDIGEVQERGTRSASASCAFIKGGEAPQTDAQLKKLKGENLKLGVLPGDAYCQVTLFCSLATDEGDFKKKCTESAKKEADLGTSTTYEGDSTLGQFSCVRKTDRPPNDFAFTYRTIDKDTRCIFEVMGGPSVVSEELVQNCTRAAMESISMANLKKFQ